MILLVANLGSKGGAIGGQNIRSRNIKKLFSIMYNNVSTIDVSKLNLLSMYYLFKYIITCEAIVILPGANFLRLLSKINYVFKLKKIYLVAIGGWIANDINKYPHYNILKYTEKLFVQTKGLKDKLDKHKIKSIILPNFKFQIKKIDEPSRVNKNKLLKVVFCSRVCKEKGILLAINSIKNLCNVNLYIYGPEHNIKISKYIKNYKNIYYKGEIDSDDVPKTIAKYDIFLFPTMFKGEGFPGAILDAMYAGLPIIASNWKYNKEYVNKNNGILVKTNSTKCIINAIEQLDKNREKMYCMAVNSYNIGKTYTSEKCLKIINKNISV